jgi:hypothetical protein
MMNWADKRLTVEKIKNHPWFFGADWNSLRYIEPPFVPRLNSVTDTSYFPTDDLGNVNTQLDQVESVSAEKDLAFLGYVLHSNHPSRHGVNKPGADSHSRDLQEVRGPVEGKEGANSTYVCNSFNSEIFQFLRRQSPSFASTGE